MVAPPLYDLSEMFSDEKKIKSVPLQAPEEKVDTTFAKALQDNGQARAFPLPKAESEEPHSYGQAHWTVETYNGWGGSRKFSMQELMDAGTDIASYLRENGVVFKNVDGTRTLAFAIGGELWITQATVLIRTGGQLITRLQTEMTRSVKITKRTSGKGRMYWDFEVK